ncbi:MAG: phenylalanine--tRNA ligase subunit beta [Chitinophagaceae bacterium]
MTISYKWLLQYLEQPLSTTELAEILTSVGLEVEHISSYEKFKGGLKGLVVGQVLACEPIPETEKLKITSVSIGQGEPLSIVCGAPNVAAGQKVLVATVGTQLYPSSGDSFQIKKAKIRGFESAGMLCAEDEIGLGESHAGIMILPEDTPLGLEASQYFNIDEADTIYEIGLTPNRMDGMSYLGIAKDVVAYLNNKNQDKQSVKIPSTDASKQAIARSNEKPLQISIEDKQKCLRYAGICLDNIEVKDSPAWLQNALLAIGLKPINIVVDVTNYVLKECGQPLHAFDRDEITGNEIRIGSVENKTKFWTLDNKEIELQASDLMILNSQEAMCMAGVYGGLKSGIKNTSTRIFLESAFFQKDSIRKSSMHHGLRTDAATRFEKGADMSKVIFALERASDLLVQYANAKIASALYDIYPEPIEATRLVVAFQKVRGLTGKNYTDLQIKNILLSLQYKIIQEDEKSIEVEVPFSNPDVSIVPDIIEEIMRIDGIDNIPFTGAIQYNLPEQKGFQSNPKKTIVDTLVAKGFYEILTNSITSAAYYDDQTQLVKMMNSLSENLDAMRASMLESGLEVVAYNLNRKNQQLKFFEIGKTYQLANTSFIEKNMLSLYASGQYRLPFYKEKNQKIDLYYMRGVIESIFSSLKFSFEQIENGLAIKFQNKQIGSIQHIDEQKRKQFGIKQELEYAEMDWDVLQNALQNQRFKVKEIPKYPTVQRDLAFVLAREVSYIDIENAFKQAKCKYLTSYQLFDVYQNEKMGESYISYGVSFSFYNPIQTLTDTEVEADVTKIIKTLETKLSAQIRTT